MNLLSFYMFLEATGTMALYQANMQLLTDMSRLFQPIATKTTK